MTGRYPHRNGALGFDPVLKVVPNLPEALQEDGYHNSLLGKGTHVVKTRHAAFDIIRTQEEPATHCQSVYRADEVVGSILKALDEGGAAEDPQLKLFQSQMELDLD